MATNEIALSDIEVEQRSQIIRQNLRALGRYDWSLWALAVVVTLSLTAAIISFSMSTGPTSSEPSDAFYMNQSLRGLVALILLFSIYTLFQQIQLRKKRVQVAELVEFAAQQQLRAEDFLRLAKLDPLTGLHNRRYAHEQIATEVARARRNNTSLTVLRLNLDDFQQLSESYGHSMGDAALVIFGKRLNASIRGSDVAVRLGGDEFVVLLPECKPGDVQVVLNRLTPLEMEFESKRVSLSFSAGRAGYREGETAEQLLQRADHALHVEKMIQKNQGHPVV